MATAYATPEEVVGRITGAPILFQQAIPVFADVDPVTLNITPETVAARITPRTRAIVATHLFGNPCDVLGITRIAVARGIPVIEDCSQAFLATQNGQLLGTIGRMGAFSLQQSAHMTTGQGGALITSDDTVARTATLFRDKGWGHGDPDPDHYILALNYRMTELQGAVARAQLQKLTRAVRRRRRTAERLSEQLAGLPGITLPEARPGSTHVYWRYALSADPTIIRGGSDAIKALALGADAVCLGRPYVWGLALEGQAGVETVLKMILAELDLSLALCGYTTPSQLSPAALAR